MTNIISIEFNYIKFWKKEHFVSNLFSSNMWMLHHVARTKSSQNENLVNNLVIYQMRLELRINILLYLLI